MDQEETQNLPKNPRLKISKCKLLLNFQLDPTSDALNQRFQSLGVENPSSTVEISWGKDSEQILKKLYE